MAFVELADASRVDVEANNLAFFSKFHCEWEAYVSEADNGDFFHERGGKIQDLKIQEIQRIQNSRFKIQDSKLGL